MKTNSTEPKTIAQKLDYCFRIFLVVLAVLGTLFFVWIALLLMFVAEGYGQREVGIGVAFVAVTLPWLAIRLMRQKRVKPNR